MLGIGLLLSVLSGGILWFSYCYPGIGEQWSVTFHNGCTRILLLGAVLAGCLAHEAVAKQGTRLLLGLGVLGLVWLDFQTHVPPQNPTVAPSVYAPHLISLQELKPLPRMGQSRLMVHARSHSQYQSTMLSNLANGYLCERLGQFNSCNLLEEIPKIDSAYSLHIYEYQRLYYHFWFSSNVVELPLADYLGISQVSSLEKDFTWVTRRTWMPLLTAGQKPVFADSTNTFTAVLSTEFRPRQEIYLPLEAKGIVKATNGTGARIWEYRVETQHIEAEVEAPEASLVSVAQSYYHPWKAYVDGQPARLWRANYAFQALEVPPGRHRLELVYQDRAFILGSAVSVMTLGLLATLGYREWQRSRMFMEAT